ncbi:hypothetical protein ATO13_23561 [Stappia sp. 22II-S9-Z10]|nr:hypothetical protein ATO13_23561 [Stappia sp. 22II-S9-Z10]
MLIEFVQREFVARGFVADVAIHDYGRGFPAMGGSEAQQKRIRELATAGIPFLERDEAKASGDAHVMVVRNKAGEATSYKLYQPHAHVRITPRAMHDGEWIEDKKASRYFNRHETAMNWRYDWPKLQNAYLERVGSDVRVTSTSHEEDGWPNVLRQPTGENAVTHAIEEREHRLSDEQREKHEAAKLAERKDRKFKERHNQTLRQAFEDQHSESSQEAEDDQRARRQTAWWRNMTQRYNQWRFDFKDQASEWGERFRLQRERMKLLLGWHIDDPEANEVPRAEPLQAGNDRAEHEEREQERQLHHPPDRERER